jgi:hypothetical protein
MQFAQFSACVGNLLPAFRIIREQLKPNIVIKQQQSIVPWRQSPKLFPYVNPSVPVP